MITRLETYIETVKTETEADIVQLKVKLKNVTFLHKNIEELRGNYYAIPNAKEAEIVTIYGGELNQMDERLEKLEVRMKTAINSSCKKTISETVVNKINNNAVDLWSEKISWDNPLPPHIEKGWRRWCEELPHLENLKIPRLVLDSTLDGDIVQLDSFCDARKKAYGASIYLKSGTRNGISVKLVTSKSRVAPLNSLTLPILELLGALIAARLTCKVGKFVNSKRSCVQYHWTDSKRWKQFFANRVYEITSLTDPNS
ncbi:hypothetical protein AVEN_111344-1 [Araneus ventricosus]|uniref:Uncharacterized protein n=1 Tax=Araneus ventricosus TaxID=182803 RepID=A0A4Y2GHD4_ARAVE|nr:hypothetical protein AVEN_111344-1 [Araneus ventricosus]